MAAGHGSRGDAITLIDHAGNAIGESDKTAVHRDGLIHRAVSVFLFDSAGRLLLQRRAAKKYHSAGLWANTCCTHPRPRETPSEAAHRRLGEEMGIACPLRELFAFTYRVSFDNGLIEHEFDHVFAGLFNGRPHPETSEVQECKWVEEDALLADIARNPKIYAHWLKLCVRRVLSEFNSEVFRSGKSGWCG